MKPLFITTPIYYVNAKPHIGHAYTSIACDVLARYHRLRGRTTYLLTGTDEHGINIERRAREEGLEPKALADRIAPLFRATSDLVESSYDDFIRTTEPRHQARVQRLWRMLEEAGDIYLGEYEDWYCASCENFYTEKDLLEGNLCPIHKRPIERVKEKSYFFRLSKYGDRLLEFYEKNPSFVRPEGRFNEVKNFVREGLRDLSISRNSFRWGVPVPGNPEHVVYVWLDALTNYMSALGGPPDAGKTAPMFERFWGPNADVLHVVGKEIMRFHAVYWPAFLMSAGIAPPTAIYAHGWLTVNGEKMSKTAGNFLAPGPLVDAFGADVLRYYLMRDVGFGQDGDFSHANLFARYHGELANGLGNLLNRIVASIVRTSFGGRVPEAHTDALDDVDRQLIATAESTAKEVARHMEAIAPNRALDTMWELVNAANKYVDQTAPWALAKSGDTARLARVSYTVLETLRWVSTMLWPIMPAKCNALRAQLGLPPILPTEGLDRWPSVWGGLQSSRMTRPGEPLFPRFDKKQEQSILDGLGVARPKDPEQSERKTAPKPGAGTPDRTTKPMQAVTEPGATQSNGGAITYDDFAKVDLRVGQVVKAERVPKSDKLLRLEIDLGEEAPRQVLAGIGKAYEPEILVGTRLVVVANLAPRKLMGLESHGMVLAGGSEDSLRVLAVDAAVSPGTRVK